MWTCLSFDPVTQTVTNLDPCLPLDDSLVALANLFWKNPAVMHS